jgi:outer membrane protein OmpA-like peptidoglycan-associated protein
MFTGVGPPGMVVNHWTKSLLVVGLTLSWSAAWAAAPQAQYTVEDIKKAFADPPAAETSGASTDQSLKTPAAGAAGGACESSGKVTGPDGLCYPANASTAGFNLGRRVSASSSGQGQARTAPRPLQKVVHTTVHRDLLITFKQGSAELTDQGQANAKVFATALKEVPQLTEARFQLSGYTDATGAQSKNMALSQQRADAVKGFLMGLGVDGARLTAKGYGAHDFLPGIPSTSPDNRRVVATKE